MDRALLVADKDMGQARLGNPVVDVDDRPAGVAEHDLHAFPLEAFQEHLGSVELHTPS